MRWLVVYDGVDEVRAIENVNTTLQQALELASQELSRNKKLEDAEPEVLIEIEICVLQMLLEEFPLDDYLGEMEQATAHDLAQVSQLLQQSQLPKIQSAVKILRGLDKEASHLIAEEARTWKADRIYLPLEEACWQCQKPPVVKHNPLKAFLSRWKQKEGEAQVEDTQKNRTAVSMPALLGLAPCPVYSTCHGEVVFSLHVQRSAAPIVQGTQH